MNLYIKKEKTYRNVSVIVILCVSIVWVVAMSHLMYTEWFKAYTFKHTVNYSRLFHDGTYQNISVMSIYLNDRYMGQTQTVITEAEDEGRDISSQTNFRIQSPLGNKSFIMNSKIHVLKSKKLDSFVMNIHIPLLQTSIIHITGKVLNNVLQVDIPEFDYHEKMPIKEDLMISSGISPFGDIVSVREGMQWNLSVFSPVSRSIETVTVKVVGTETIRVNDEQRTLYRLESYDSSNNRIAVAWTDRYGQILEEEVYILGMKLRMCRND